MTEDTEAVIRNLAQEGESFSATISRLIGERAQLAEDRPTPDWIGSWDGPGDLSLRVEEVLEELAREGFED